jgi:hypothetical protein
MFQAMRADHPIPWASVTTPPGRSFLEAKVGRKRNCIINLEIDALRQSSSYMAGHNVKGPFGILVSI